MQQKRRFQQTDIVDSTAFDVSSQQAEYERKQKATIIQSEKRSSELKSFVSLTVAFIGSLVTLVAFLTAIIGNIHTFIGVAGAIMQIILQWVIPGIWIAVILLIGNKVLKHWRDFQYENRQLDHMQAEIDAMNDEQKRLNARNDAEVAEIKARAELLQAQADQMRATLPFDDQGNLFVWDRNSGFAQYVRGQYREFPNLSTYHNAPRITSVQEEQAAQITAPATQQSRPAIEKFYKAIPFNSCQTGLGAEADSGQLVIVPIRKSVHFKFVGQSGQGKTCVAASTIDIAATTNDPDHLKLGILDLEWNTGRLFEDLPHIAELGPRRTRLVGRDPDEVARRLEDLQYELRRRAALGEAYCAKHEPVLLTYIEEALALKYEVVDEKLKKRMLAAINILGVRARKYGIFLLVCMQVDYSDKSTREAMGQFRTRGAFGLDPEAARASGFFNTELVKQNFLAGQQGQYVLEKPSYSKIILATEYDVEQKLLRLEDAATVPTTPPAIERPKVRVSEVENSGSVVGGVVAQEPPTTDALEAISQPLTPQERRIIQKYRQKMSVKAIIASEFTNSKGDPLTGGDLFVKKTEEIQQLIARFLPIDEVM